MTPVPTTEETDQIPNFTDLGLDGRILTALDDLGYEKPSPVQAATIPHLLEGKDVMGLAQTGTGKTAAFALPALSTMAALSDVNGPAKTPQTLVLAPTRELALQVAEAFTSYAKHLPELKVLPVYGGAPYGPQLGGLRRGAQIVVGTPGRVIDHIERGSLDLSDLQHMILDEADEMLRMGFAEEVDKILAQTPEDKQIALFSATMPPAIRRIGQKYLNDPIEVKIAATATTAKNIRQRFIHVVHARKLDAMTRVLETEQHDGVITFVRTKSATEEVAQKLAARGYQAAAINGDIPQKLREKTVEDLRAGRIDILVATDVAARGLDVERISHVINYDIPHDTESYVHRIGRTGRAGRTGDAILFVTPREKHMLRQIEKATKQAVEQMNIPTVGEVNQNRLQRFGEQIGKTLHSQELETFRELVVEYENTHDDATMEDIAAALAFMAQGGRPLLLDEEEITPPAERRKDRGERGERGGERGGKFRKDRSIRPGQKLYRIALGRRDRLRAGSVVGAIANEAGLSKDDIGDISIRSDYTLVELPERLSSSQLKALSTTEIAGKRIDLQEDPGRRPRGAGAPVTGIAGKNKKRFADGRKKRHRHGF
ncbi:DEAD/DEAH box helicase [Micrococcoides hystricis]|uniref:ATP-dependent RNA helicase DeaD n=1 Tax=Micrococcoides hystricis TaxID=1572761 RepID=A0ABV6PAJ1_9MICC